MIRLENTENGWNAWNDFNTTIDTNFSYTITTTGTNPVNNYAIGYYQINDNMCKCVTTDAITKKEGSKKDMSKKHYNSYFIKDVTIEYETIKNVKVNQNERDDNGNYKATVTYEDIPKKVIVTFNDGSKQEAICDKDDVFNLEVGISVCLTKKLLADKYSMYVGDYGKIDPTKVYNDIIRSGLKQYNRNLAEKEAEEKKAEAAKKREAAKQRRRIRKAEKKKEREIEILAEAIRRANAVSNK